MLEQFFTANIESNEIRSQISTQDKVALDFGNLRKV